MVEYNCKQTIECERCGDCCRFRPPKTFSEFEDNNIREAMYEKTGIIYPFHMDRFTISITNKEKNVLESEAKRLNIAIKILPKKVIIKDDQIAVIDWFVDADVCPFLEGTNICKIYEKRPMICKIFPRTQYTKEEEQKLMLLEGDRELKFEEAVNIVNTAINIGETNAY